MTAKLKLGGSLAAFFLAAIVATNAGPMQPSPDFDWKFAGPAPLSTEQMSLVSHLADKYDQPLPLAERIVRASYKEAQGAGLPPLLVLAIIEKESSLRPDAVSRYGAMGLMQVVPRFHPEKLKAPGQPEEELLHPEDNIRVGVRVLTETLALKGGDLTRALKAYSGNATNYAGRVAFFRSALEKVTAGSSGQNI